MTNSARSSVRRKKNVVLAQLTDFEDKLDLINCCNIHEKILLKPELNHRRVRIMVIVNRIGHIGYLPHEFPLTYVDRVFTEKPFMQIDDIVRNKDGIIINVYIKIRFLEQENK